MDLPLLPRYDDPPIRHQDGTAIISDDPLVDRFGRRHTHLRISVTDRCNLRCTYCMPEDVVFRDKSELLTFEEIIRVSSVAASMGIRKIRLTGGEPLLRRGLPELIRGLVQLTGIDDVSLTTNGILLADQAADLRASGLKRLNISLDTLDPNRFREIARRDGLDKVLAGIETACAQNFEQIKINAVSLRGVTEHDGIPLAHYCRQRGIELRFIETMPIGANPWERDTVFSAADLLHLFEREFGPSIPVAGQDPSAPATEYLYGDRHGKFGIIASITRPFCGHCNRIRLTAEGKVRNCLFALSELDVRTLLRQNGSDEQIAHVIQYSIANKWEGHEINTGHFHKPNRTMHTIGG